MDRKIRSQIEKDRLLMDDPGSDVRSVVWVFTASPTTGLIGPTPGVRQALTEAGVSYIILTK